MLLPLFAFALGPVGTLGAFTLARLLRRPALAVPSSCGRAGDHAAGDGRRAGWGGAAEGHPAARGNLPV